MAYDDASYHDPSSINDSLSGMSDGQADSLQGRQATNSIRAWGYGSGGIDSSDDEDKKILIDEVPRSDVRDNS